MTATGLERSGVFLMWEVGSCSKTVPEPWTSRSCLCCQDGGQRKLRGGGGGIIMIPPQVAMNRRRTENGD